MNSAVLRSILALSSAGQGMGLVSKNAVLMRNMTQSNLWYRTRQVDYMRHTTNYQKSVDALYFSAIDKNLDVATDASAKVARSCVECPAWCVPTSTSNSFWME
jgi:hypothetical protein